MANNSFGLTNLPPSQPVKNQNSDPSYQGNTTTGGNMFDGTTNPLGPTNGGDLVNGNYGDFVKDVATGSGAASDLNKILGPAQSNYNPYKGIYTDQLDWAIGAGKTALSQATPWAQNQEQLRGLLMQQANGTAPSAAEIQMNQGNDAAIRAASARANSARGITAGMAAQQAQDTQANLAQTNVADTAAMRAQEQARAQGQLGTMDTSMNQFYTNLGYQLPQNAYTNISNQYQAANTASMNQSTANAQMANDSKSKILGMGSDMFGGLMKAFAS